MPMIRTVLTGMTVTLAAVATVGSAGCGYFEEVQPPWVGEHVAGAEEVDQSAFTPRAYPASTPIAREVDIEVVPENGRTIRIDNRTVHAYENAELWLNQQYGGRLDAVAIGHNDPIFLDSFVNEHGEAYPIAKFLAKDKYQPLVAADLIVDGRMYKLHVRLDNWRHP